MKHLNDNGITTSLPQPSTSTDIPIPASIHEMPVHSKDHSPCKLLLRLFSWVPGRTMDSVKMLPLEALADAGRFLGRLSQSLSNLDTKKLAAARRYHQWDGKNTRDLKGFVQYVDDPIRRSMVESVIEAFQKDIIESKVAEVLPVSLIHADFNDANILLDKNCRVSGVIDFGDSVERYVLCN
jgi:Ser/Thr protein kinase RdoA (MazF antagonist)